MNSEQREVCLHLLSLFKLGDRPFNEIITEGQLVIFYEFIFRPHKRLQILTSTRYGKSLIIALACIIISCIQKEVVAVLAPTNEKAKIIMRYYIEHLGDNQLFYSQLEKNTKLERLRMEESKERIILRNGGGIYIISVQAGNSKKGIESAMGAGAKICIQDESCLIPDPIEATIFRMIAGEGKEAFYAKIGNPFYRNHFLRSFRDEKYHKIFIDYNQGIKEGRYTTEYIEEARAKPYFDILFECNFPKVDAIDSGGYSMLLGEDFLNTRIRENVPILGEVRWACDVAGEGSNYSVIVERGRNGAKVLYRENNPDTMNFVSIIVDMFNKAGNKPKKIYIDKVGIGKPVFDRLREFREVSSKIIGVMAGESPQDKTNFFNKRAEMFWRLKEWLGIGELEGKNWFDLLDIRYKIQSDRKIKIKSKDEMLKEGIMSPDCFIAGTKILTKKGEQNIENLSVEEDMVVTPVGNRKIIKLWEVETNKLVKVLFSNGKSLIGKPKHKILTKRGFVSLDTLLLTDIIETRNILSNLLWKIKKLLFIKDASIGLRKQADIFMPTYIMVVKNLGKKNHYIIEFGKIIITTGKFLMGIASIILIRIPSTIILKIWIWLSPMNIKEITCWNDLLIRNLRNQMIDNLALSAPLPLFGINQKQVENGTNNTQRSNGIVPRQSKENVSFAVKNMSDILRQKDFVQTVVSKSQNGKAKPITLIKEFVYSVKKSLWQIGIGIQNVVVESVEVFCEEKTKVYNLTLDRDNVYYANGILVENCADALSFTFYDKEDALSVMAQWSNYLSNNRDENNPAL